MKKLLLLIACVAMVVGCKKENQDDIPRQLSKVTAMEDIYEYGKPSLQEELYEEYTYSNGLVLKFIENHYDALSKSRPYDIYTKKYDSKNRLVESEKRGERVVYTYNDIDSISTKEVYGKSGLSEIYAYMYNADRKLTKMTLDDKIFADLDYYWLYTYNNTTTTAKRYLSKTNELFWTYVYEYDSRNNLIKQTNIAPTGSTQITYRATIEYSPTGKIAKHTEYNLMGDSNERAYTYNTDGTIAKIHFKSTIWDFESDISYSYEY